MIRRRVVRVPASSANLGPGYDCFAAALGLHLELEVLETGGFAVETDLAVSRGPENLCVRAFASLHPPDDFTFRIRSAIPLSGGLGSSAAAIVAGLLAADHLFELDVDLLSCATEIEGHPDNVAAAINGGLVVCADGDSTRFDPPTGLEALAVVPEQAVRTADARRALPARVPIEQAVFNVAHGALLTLGLARGDWDLVARGLKDSLHEQRRSHLFPRSYDLARRAPELGALGATISGAGPTVLVWCFYEQTGTVVEALAPLIEGWATLLRAPFELQGAYVAEM
ncbi:MAG: homoserine kinase [Solirubrobacteraceae bacterium]